MSTNKTSLQDLLIRIRSAQQKNLVAKISLFAFALQLIATIIDDTLLDRNTIESLILSEISAIAFFGFLGLAGLIVIIRKEMPQAITIRGKSAIIFGLIWCGISWSLTIRYIFLFIKDIVKLP